MDSIIDSLKSLSQLPFLRQFGLLVGLALSIATGVGIVLWSQTPDYTVLFGSLDGQDAAQVTQTLDRLGETYQLNQINGLISVPSSKVHQIRLKLASEGLPASSSRGFSMLYEEQELGTSSFIEKARYHRALEEELATSIETLDSVKAARVHLAIPKQSAFVRNRDKANASILVNLYPGRRLNDDQLAGMIYLVAASVPGLEHDDVTLVDGHGRLLSKKNSSKDLMASAEQHKLTQEVEAKFVNSIMTILVPILGEEGVRAQVVADLDFISIERTSENYDPNTVALRSEQTTEERGGAAAVTQQIVEGDLSGGEQQITPAQPAKTVRATRNYEVDHTISHIKERQGKVKKLSVALVVDYRKQVRADGSVERLQLTEQEVQQIISLVKEAVGFSEERGDTINVVNAPFLESEQIEELIETSMWEEPWVQNIGKQVVGLLGIVFLVFGVLKPLLTRLTAAGAAVATRAMPVMVGADGGVAMEVGNEHITLSGQASGAVAGAGAGGDSLQLPGYDQQLIGARNLVREDPNKVAQVIKGWVQEDG